MRSLADAMLRTSGVEIPFNCHVHGDRHASASYNRLKRVWHCHVCNASGRAEGTTTEDDVDFGTEVLSLLTEERPVYSERWLDQFDAGGPGAYWLSRFSASACRAFRLGVDHGTGQSVYPLRGRDGQVLGVVRRTDGRPKYLYPRGVATSELLFGYERADAGERVVLVEGAMDVVAAWEAGVSALGLYGARLSAAQLVLLHRLDPREVVLALDNDAAGRSAMLGHWRSTSDRIPGIAEQLEVAGLDVRCVDWSGEEAKDVAELSVERRRMLLADPN